MKKLIVTTISTISILSLVGCTTPQAPIKKIEPVDPMLMVGQTLHYKVQKDTEEIGSQWMLLHKIEKNESVEANPKVIHNQNLDARTPSTSNVTNQPKVVKVEEVKELEGLNKRVNIEWNQKPLKMLMLLVSANSGYAYNTKYLRKESVRDITLNEFVIENGSLEDVLMKVSNSYVSLLTIEVSHKNKQITLIFK